MRKSVGYITIKFKLQYGFSDEFSQSNCISYVSVVFCLAKLYNYIFAENKDRYVWVSVSRTSIAEEP